MRIQTGDRNSSSYDYGYGQESRGLPDGGARLRRPASAVETRRAALDERRELHGEGAVSAESIRLLGKASDAFVAGFSERWFLGRIESVTADAPAKA